jgi:hypothetical protein
MKLLFVVSLLSITMSLIIQPDKWPALNELTLTEINPATFTYPDTTSKSPDLHVHAANCPMRVLKGELIVDRNGSHGTIPKTYGMPLKNDITRLKFYIFGKCRGEDFHAAYWTEGTDPRPFTKEMLFYRE